MTFLEKNQGSEDGEVPNLELKSFLNKAFSDLSSSSPTTDRPNKSVGMERLQSNCTSLKYLITLF